MCSHGYVSTFRIVELNQQDDALIHKMYLNSPKSTICVLYREMSSFDLDSPDGTKHVHFSIDRGSAWYYDTWTRIKHHYTFTQPTIHERALVPEGIPLWKGLAHRMYSVTQFQQNFQNIVVANNGIITFDFGVITIKGKIQSYHVEQFH